MKVYLANSLTSATEEFKKEMLLLRENLKQTYEVLEYFGLSAGNAQDVYNHDIACVRGCDILLAEASYPSTGLGIEIAMALNENKKVLAFAKENAKVSRMVLGLSHANYKFFTYTKAEEILEALKKYNQ